METLSADVLVIGGGAAAARAAVEAAGQEAKVLLVDKGRFEASGSSPVSLNGLVSLLGEGDSPERLFQDLVRGGGYLNEQPLAWAAAQGAVENRRQLEDFGLVFRRGPDGDYSAQRGLGHSAPRTATLDKDAMGMNPVAALGKEVWRRGVRLLDGVMVTRLLKEGEAVAGAVGVSREGRLHLFRAKAVVLAAGGANHLYPNWATRIADRKYGTTGDAFALALFASAPLIDLEFPNFREGDNHLSSTVGGWFANALGERFMERYDPERRDYAPRGRLAEAIYREERAGRGPIYIQLPGHDLQAALHGRVPVSQDQASDRLPVVIDYQRLLGGARINEWAETPIPGLFAAGESAGGFHGADRMQSTGFLETTFFGARAGARACAYARARGKANPAISQARDEARRIQSLRGEVHPTQVKQQIQKIMWEHASILRDAHGLETALDRLAQVNEKHLPRLSTTDLFGALEVANLALTAEMVVRAALMRQESRGSHRREDYPRQEDPHWRCHIGITWEGGRLALAPVPVAVLPKAA